MRVLKEMKLLFHYLSIKL